MKNHLIRYHKSLRVLISSWKNIAALIIRYGSYLSPKIAGRLLSLFWFKVQKFPAHPGLQNWRAESIAIPIQHREKGYFAYRRTPPTVSGQIVLLHGWAGRWDQLLDIGSVLVANNFEVISFDFPAHGDNSEAETDLFEMGEFIKNVTTALKLKSPNFVCHSAGFLALSIAKKIHHQEIDKLITINSPARFEHIIDLTRRRLQFSPSFDKEIWKMIGSRTGLSQPQKLMDAKHMSSIDDVNVFLIHDQDDRAVDVSELQNLHEIWPISKTLKTQGFGHNKILKQMTVIDQIVQFLQGRKFNYDFNNR